MKNADREKLLDRIRKLYAMSREQESSPHEAEIALRRCQSLMQRFGITEADLETSEFGVSTIGRQFRAIPSYVGVMSSAVALLHDCVCVDTGTIEFRGYSIDTEVASMTFAYLTESMEQSLKVRKKIGSVEPGRAASFDYRVGFAVAVLERCRTIDAERKAFDKKAELAQSGISGGSLVVRKLAMVREGCLQDVQIGRKRRVRYRNGDAHAAGATDGNKVSLNTQIE